jgi:hypothetical protein
LHVGQVLPSHVIEQACVILEVKGNRGIRCPNVSAPKEKTVLHVLQQNSHKSLMRAFYFFSLPRRTQARQPNLGSLKEA